MLYLYNKLLRQRHCFVRLQRERIARRARRYPALVSPEMGGGGWGARGKSGRSHVGL